MNGFEKRREQKKKDILAAAGKLFFEKGFKETSVEEIAKLAKVSPVSVYNFLKPREICMYAPLSLHFMTRWIFMT